MIYQINNIANWIYIAERFSQRKSLGLFYFQGGVWLNYQEYRQSLNQKLAEKVERELADFREDILSKSPQEVYDVAYQIILKNDIAECFSDVDYSPQAAKAFMKSPNLLQDVYEEWLGREDSHMDELRQTIADFKSYMVKTEKILSGKERWLCLDEK